MSPTIASIALAVLVTLPLSGMTVNNLGDAPDANPGDEICAIAGGGCTLRAAIEEVNASHVSGMITFSVAGTLAPATPYPPITGQLLIDGKSAPGYSTPVIIIDGGGTIPIGLDYAAGSDGYVRGLEIRGFSTTAISVAGRSMTISANYLGPIRGGKPNGDGLQLQPSSYACWIGTFTTPADRNIISGNSRYGVRVQGFGHQFRYNYIGTNVSGTAALPNGSDGILIGTGADHISIDGGFAMDNIVSGNGGNGIAIRAATTVTISGVYIGTNAAGTSIPNALDGVSLTSGAHDIQVAGGGPERNVICGNGGNGITIDSTCSGIRVEANYIGTTFALTALGNKGYGISDSGTSTVIGYSHNYVSNNGLDGIYIGPTSGTAIHSNHIENNGGNGIHLHGATSVIIDNGEINRNKLDGIRLDANTSGVSIAVSGIYGNGALGIDLNADGVTANDSRDSDSGPNGLQNFPVIISAVPTPTEIPVLGTLNSTPNTTFVLDFYTSPAADSSNYGEGERWAARTTVTTDGSGNATFTVSPIQNVEPGRFIVATATGPSGTSEFSRAVLIGDLPTIQFSSATYSVTEDGVAATITVTRSGNTTVSSTINYATSDGSATQPGDYTAASGTLTFDPGVTSRTFTVPITNDSTHEPAETLNVTLSGPSVATLGAQSTAVLTIDDDDPVPTVTIDDVTHSEGASGTKAFTFTATLSSPSASPVMIDYATANGTAAAGSDYATASGTLTFAPGVTTQTITVDVNGDAIFESDETFFVNLANGSRGTGTIVNDDIEPAITIGNVSKNEGNSGTTAFTFTVTLAAVAGAPVTIAYETASGTARSGSDYASASGAITFAPGATTQTITVDVNGDAIFESDETFFVNLANGSHGTGTIENDDAEPAITINDVTKNEGSSGTTAFTFTVTRSGVSESSATVGFETASDSATAGIDYTAAIGTLTFAPGVTTLTITVDVIGDTLYESDETFFVNLSNGSQGTGTIVNDDTEPSITIDNVAKNEGNAGMTAFTFTVTRSATSALTDTVTYTTTAGTATAGIDFIPAFGTLTFAPGVTMQSITVDVAGDTLFEPNETFFVNLSNGTHGRGTIVNDDAASANLSIAMTTEPSWFTPGQAVLFKITVTNSGPGAATDLVVTDAIPPPMTFISATSPDFTCAGTMIVTCSSATLAAGASATISLAAFASGTEPIVNTASVIANASAPASATVQIAPPPRRRPMRH